MKKCVSYKILLFCMATRVARKMSYDMVHMNVRSNHFEKWLKLAMRFFPKSERIVVSLLEYYQIVIKREKTHSQL
jgi:hypothetical protein